MLDPEDPAGKARWLTKPSKKWLDARTKRNTPQQPDRSTSDILEDIKAGKEVSYGEVQRAIRELLLRA